MILLKSMPYNSLGCFYLSEPTSLAAHIGILLFKTVYELKTITNETCNIIQWQTHII